MDEIDKIKIREAIMKFYNISEQQYYERIENATITWGQLIIDIAEKWNELE